MAPKPSTMVSKLLNRTVPVGGRWGGFRSLRPRRAGNSGALGAQRLAHHRPRELAPRDLREAGAIVHRLAAEPHRLVRRPFRPVDGIGLEPSRAADARELDGAIEHGRGDAAPADPLRGVEADDGPYGLVVDGLHQRRALEARVFLPRPERYPADRLTVAIADQSRHRARIDERLERAFRVLGTRHSLRDFGAARASVKHAPAPADLRAACTVEQRLEVAEALGGERMDLEARTRGHRTKHTANRARENRASEFPERRRFPGMLACRRTWFARRRICARERPPRCPSKTTRIDRHR